MRESLALARAYGVHVHTHLAETRDEEQYCLATFGRRPVELVSDMAPLGGVTPDPAGEPVGAWERVSVDDLLKVLPRVKSPFREVFHLHALERRSYLSLLLAAQGGEKA